MRFSFLTVALLSVAALAGCAEDKKSDEGGKKELVWVLNEQWVRLSCAHPFTEGKKVDSKLPAPNLQKVAFGKELDLAWLDKVADASSESTYKFMLSTGVRVHSTTVKERGGCKYMGNIPYADQTLQAKWDSLSAQGSVLGVYFGGDEMQPLTGQKKPVIMLRDDTDRYTLVHEFMHHAFNVVRESKGIFILEEKANFVAAMEKAKRLEPKSDSEKKDGNRLNLYAKAWAHMVKTTVALLEGYSLEEATIENLLSDYQAKGKLWGVAKLNRENSHAYIRQSVKYFNQLAGEFAEDAVMLSKLMDAVPEYQVEEGTKEVLEALELLKTRVDEGRKIQAASQRNGISGSDFGGFDLESFSAGNKKNEFSAGFAQDGVETQEVHNHVGCSHAQGGDIVQIMKEQGLKWPKIAL